MGLQEFVSHLLDLAHPDFLVLQFVVVEGYVVKDDDFFHIGAFGKDGADLGQVVAGNQDPLGVRMVDAENEVLPFSQVHGQGDVRCTGVEGAQLGQDPHGAAFGQEGDLVSFLQAQRHQACTDAVGFFAGLALGDYLPVAVHLLPQIGMVFIFAGILFYKVNNGNSFCHNSLGFYSVGKRP